MTGGPEFQILGRVKHIVAMAQPDMKVLRLAEPHPAFGIRLLFVYNTLVIFTSPQIHIAQALHRDALQRFSRLAVESDERVRFVGDESQARHLNVHHQDLVGVDGILFGRDQKSIQTRLDRRQRHQGGMPQQVVLFGQVHPMFGDRRPRHHLPFGGFVFLPAPPTHILKLLLVDFHHSEISPFRVAIAKHHRDGLVGQLHGVQGNIQQGLIQIIQHLHASLGGIRVGELVQNHAAKLAGLIKIIVVLFRIRTPHILLGEIVGQFQGYVG